MEHLRSFHFFLLLAFLFSLPQFAKLEVELDNYLYKNLFGPFLKSTDLHFHNKASASGKLLVDDDGNHVELFVREKNPDMGPILAKYGEYMVSSNLIQTTPTPIVAASSSGQVPSEVNSSSENPNQDNVTTTTEEPFSCDLCVPMSCENTTQCKNREICKKAGDMFSAIGTDGFENACAELNKFSTGCSTVNHFHAAVKASNSSFIDHPSYYATIITVCCDNRDFCDSNDFPIERAITAALADEEARKDRNSHSHVAIHVGLALAVICLASISCAMCRPWFTKNDNQEIHRVAWGLDIVGPQANFNGDVRNRDGEWENPLPPHVLTPESSPASSRSSDDANPNPAVPIVPNIPEPIKKISESSNESESNKPGPSTSQPRSSHHTSPSKSDGKNVDNVSPGPLKEAPAATDIPKTNNSETRELESSGDRQVRFNEK